MQLVVRNAALQSKLGMLYTKKKNVREEGCIVINNCNKRVSISIYFNKYIHPPSYQDPNPLINGTLYPCYPVEQSRLQGYAGFECKLEFETPVYLRRILT